MVAALVLHPQTKKQQKQSTIGTLCQFPPLTVLFFSLLWVFEGLAGRELALSTPESPLMSGAIFIWQMSRIQQRQSAGPVSIHLLWMPDLYLSYLEITDRTFVLLSAAVRVFVYSPVLLVFSRLSVKVMCRQRPIIRLQSRFNEDDSFYNAEMEHICLAFDMWLCVRLMRKVLFVI